jgi:hypothetical protein
MNLRESHRKSHLARQLYFRTWWIRYFATKFSRGTSFSQAGKDLKMEEFIGEVRWFVDIGAHDGISGSNTLYFALSGAHGLSFGPVQETYTKLHWLHAMLPTFFPVCRKTEDTAHPAVSTLHQSVPEKVGSCALKTQFWG